MNLPPNRATLWAEIFVDELYRAGVRQACVAPGSRSTPLTLAFFAHGGFRIHSLLDERGAAFYALGLGMATGVPAAVVCTSGTAAAEFFPAVIEASQSQVPLILLTADRPAELRDSGANQSIDQIKLYGDYARWFVDVAPPEKEPSALVLRYLRATADRAVSAALGQPALPGPVQINFPFRKPLEPVPTAGDVPADLDAYAPLWDGRPDNQPLTRLTGSRRLADALLVKDLAETVRSASKGLIVCGLGCPEKDFPSAVSALAAQLGWPALADPLSGVRFGPHTQRADIISAYDLFLNADTPSAGMTLRFGGMPSSKALMDYLERLPTDAPQVAVRPYGDWQDSAYTLSALIAADPTDLVSQLTTALQEHPIVRDETWLGYWQQAEIRARSVVSRAGNFEGALVAQVVDALPDPSNLVIANSLPVRHLDSFGASNLKQIRVFANRGASGIDGTLSTAFGVAAASTAPTVLVTGDLSMYHDLNGLLAARRCGVKLTIVLLNNDGGGIFRRLPISQFEPPFTDLFLTSHGLEFSHAAAMFGLGYRSLNEQDDLPEALAQALSAPESFLLEIRTDSAVGEQTRMEIINSLKSS